MSITSTVCRPRSHGLRPAQPKTHAMRLPSDSRRPQAAPLPVARPEERVRHLEEELQELRERITLLNEENQRLRATAVPEEVEEEEEDAEELALLARLDAMDETDIRVRYADKFKEWIELQPVLYYEAEIRLETEVARFWKFLLSTCPVLQELQGTAVHEVVGSQAYVLGSPYRGPSSEPKNFEMASDENEHEDVVHPDSISVEEVEEDGSDKAPHVYYMAHSSPYQGPFSEPAEEYSEVPSDEDEHKEVVFPDPIFFEEVEEDAPDKENAPPYVYYIAHSSPYPGPFSEPAEEHFEVSSDGEAHEEVVLPDPHLVEEVEEDGSEKENGPPRIYYIASPGCRPRVTKRELDGADESEEENARKRFCC